MVAIAYFMPVLACLVFHFAFGGSGDLEPYLWVLGAGWAAAGLVHWRCHSARTKATEFLGAYISALYYEESWTEVIVVRETYTDNDGKTRERERVEYRYHPEEFYFCTNLGSRFFIDERSYDLVCGTWVAPRHGDSWWGSDIRGGVRYGCHYFYHEAEGTHYDGSTEKLFTITEKHSYTNKIRNSNSVFRFEKISGKDADALGLIDYPDITDFDAPAILSRHFNVAESTDRAYRVFNSIIAPNAEMHLFVLLFDASASSVDVVEKQRSYWYGGNKNEFVVCLGLQGGEVKWARAFSWADEPVLEVKVADWFRRNPKKELADFLSWLEGNYMLWTRKEFSDFSYIRVSLAMWQVFLVILTAAAGSALAIYILLGQWR